ncbi:RNA polymerase sigma-70 factor [Myroides sp. M-43]|uniref:RNA polymerase sigma factor n=1 Tax=Myroides oncorhynchi TaxID=2893756 RepID=UPI001E39E7C3|nr:RNA polymerase sigma-70 factor [Myroides oncorhynchi]MCC9044279.1 RNA polymerase sigma-70 factor [Myroides oncorhynchi]
MISKEKKFDSLYEKHWAELYIYAFNVLRDKAIAEDIVQEVFIDYWNRMEGVEVELPRAYFFQSVRNQCAKSLNTRRFDQIQIENIAALVPELDDVQFDLIKQQLLSEIDQTACSLLPDKCLAIFKMRFYEQLSYKEIALKMNVSESTVENQINKALKLLRGNTRYITDFHFSVLLSIMC